MNELEEARKIISEVDREMAALFCRRMKAAEMVARYKKENGLPILDAEREKQIIDRSATLIEDDAIRPYYVNFIADTMKTSRAYQSRLNDGMRIAYSGTEGAFAHIAAGKIFGGGIRVPFGNFRDAYDAVEEGSCDCAVLPLENSYAGEVGETVDMLFSGSLYISGIYDLPVIHDLVGLPGARLEDIKTVISHPQALSQCANYIRRAGFQQEQYDNTARAARFVAAQKDKSLAAICSAECAELFGLTTIEHHINESRVNTTRFGVLVRGVGGKPAPHPDNRFLLMFTVRNEAGALAEAINIIGRHGYNMSTLRSRPMKELLWNYYFYVECEGSLPDNGKKLLDDLSSCCDRLKLAGMFRRLTL